MALAAGAAVVLALALGVLVVGGAGNERIADGIRIGSIDVGGLDPRAARARVRELDADVRRPLEVTYRSRRFVLRPDRAGIHVDVAATVEAARERGREGGALRRLFGGDVHATIAPRISLERAKVDGFVKRVARSVDRGARDANIDIHDGKLARTRARNGVEVQRPQLAAAIVRTISSPEVARRELKLPVTVTERPDRTLVDLAKRYPTVIGVDRDAKVLRLYENLRLKRRYKIAVGKQGLESSAGRYKIEEKIVNPPWHAPNKAWAGELAGQTIAPDDPRNPLEARWMGYHDGEGIHGTKDLDSLGTQASHGCIRMSPDAVKQLFRRVKVGTPVFMQ